jgi:hypothetical protein
VGDRGGCDATDLKRKREFMPPKFVPPAINRKSFSCPHCGALADQSWFKVHLARIRDDGLPHVASEAVLQHLRDLKKDHLRKGLDTDTIDEFISETERELKGQPFLTDGDTLYSNFVLLNVHASQCYSCGEISLWRFDSVLHPAEIYEVEPNSDMPENVKIDFDEARAILNASNRGAAALLRLCIQKLCNGLLGKELDINSAIAELVKKGLRVEVQQALDSVRVIGNESVHPGEMNIKDDRETATALFDLVNIIVEELISQPKKIKEVYAKLPAGKTAAIAKRDGQALIAGPSSKAASQA